MDANRQFNTGLIKFTFTDENGDVFSSFRMNPTDVNLLARAEEVSAYFEDRKDKVPENADGAALKAFNDEIEEKINYLLGYDVSKDIFGVITATTVNPDGEIFAWVVLDFIAEKLAPEMEKRAKKMQENVSKYTAKYHS